MSSDPIEFEESRAKRISLRILRWLKSRYKLKLWILASLILDAAAYFYADKSFMADRPLFLGFITFMAIGFPVWMLVSAIILAPVAGIIKILGIFPDAAEEATDKIRDFLK